MKKNYINSFDSENDVDNERVTDDYIKGIEENDNTTKIYPKIMDNNINLNNKNNFIFPIGDDNDVGNEIGDENVKEKNSINKFDSQNTNKNNNIKNEVINNNYINSFDYKNDGGYKHGTKYDKEGNEKINIKKKPPIIRNKNININNKRKNDDIKEGNEKYDIKKNSAIHVKKKINLYNKKLTNNYINLFNYMKNAGNERDGEDVQRNEGNNINKFAPPTINKKIYIHNEKMKNNYINSFDSENDVDNERVTDDIKGIDKNDNIVKIYPQIMNNNINLNNKRINNNCIFPIGDNNDVGNESGDENVKEKDSINKFDSQNINKCGGVENEVINSNYTNSFDYKNDFNYKRETKYDKERNEKDDISKMPAIIMNKNININNKNKYNNNSNSFNYKNNDGDESVDKRDRGRNEKNDIEKYAPQIMDQHNNMMINEEKYNYYNNSFDDENDFGNEIGSKGDKERNEINELKKIVKVLIKKMKVQDENIEKVKEEIKRLNKIIVFLQRLMKEFII